MMANHIGIIEQLRVRTNFGDFPVNNNNPKWNNARIIEVMFCPSFMDGLEFVTANQFLHFFNTLPNAFVIVIRCKNSGNHLILADVPAVINQRFSDVNRPVIIFFESINSWNILYKSYGLNRVFQEVEDLMDVEEQQVNDFGSLIGNLQNGGYGFFSGSLMQTTLNASTNAENIEPNTIEDLMEIFADRNDFLCVRFLHLFNRDLRPNVRTIQSMLRDDFLTNNVDRFAAIYGHDFHVALPDGYNLLMLAIAHRNAHAAEILIQSGINLNLTVNHINAADLACATGQFNILSILIMHNSQYPHNFDLQHRHLEELGDIEHRTRTIHSQIVDADEYDDFETSRDIIVEAASIFPNLKYWYDLSNQSAVTKAILCRKFRIYQLLLEIGLYLGPYEDIAAIRQRLFHSEQQRIADINAEIVQNLQRDYLLILRTNSLPWQNNPEHQVTADRIDEAFEILNENGDIQPILQIVAASRDFRIIFDFNRTSVEAIDFTSHDETEGVFQSVQATNFHIYIGAQDLLTEETKLRTIGTLVHELCHFAMLLTYENRCNPYERNDQEGEASFDIIAQRCMAISLEGNDEEREEIVALVNNYHPAKQHAEMITRAPQMMMVYRGSPRLDQLQNNYNDLFTDYRTRVVQDVTVKITQVRDNFYEKIRLEHTYWVKKARKEMIVRYSLASAIVMAICIVIGLSFAVYNLNGCKADLNNDCTWDMLNDREKTEILDTVVSFQGHDRTIRDVTDESPDILSRLSFGEVRNPKNIVLNHRNWVLDFEYFERKFAYADDGYTHVDRISGESNDKDTCKYRYMDELSLDDIQNSEVNRLYLLTGEPLSGKTTEMMKIAENLTQANQVTWVSYLNFSNPNIENYVGIAIWSAINLTNFLLAVKGINQHSFEAEIFKRNFEVGDVILFIDHIDWMFMKNEEFTSNFLKNLIEKSHKNAELWFGTRSWYSDKIEEILNDSRNYSKYKLLPLYCHNRASYLSKLLSSTSLTDIEVSSTLDRLNEIFSSIEVWRNQMTMPIDNIYLLKVMANHTAKSILSNKSSINLYKTLDEYIRKTADFNSSYKDPARNLFGKSIMLHVLRRDFGSSLRDVDVSLLIDDYGKEHYDYDLPRSNADISQISDGFVHKELKLGLFVKNDSKLDFLARIYFEYFVARYMHDELWMKIRYASDEFAVIFENKINLLLNFYWDMTVKFPVVKRCIDDFAKDNKASDENKVKFNPAFKHLFRLSFVKFANNTNIKFGKSMIELFDDQDLLNILKLET